MWTHSTDSIAREQCVAFAYHQIDVIQFCDSITVYGLQRKHFVVFVTFSLVFLCFSILIELSQGVGEGIS